MSRGMPEDDVGQVLQACAMLVVPVSGCCHIGPRQISPYRRPVPGHPSLQQLAQSLKIGLLHSCQPLGLSAQRGGAT